MKTELPQSQEQIIKFFNDFIRKDDIANHILKLRKELGIPKAGIPFTKEDWEEMESVEPELFVSNNPPKLFSLLDKDQVEKVENEDRLFGEFMNFLNDKEKFNLYSFYISYMFRSYIIYNKILPYFPSNFTSNDLLCLEPISLALKEKNISNYLKNKDKKYSLILYINPHVSQRQMIDFISRNWEYIKKHRNNKLINYNKVRTREKQHISDLAHENKELPRNKVASLVNKKFGTDHDEATISKVISVEIKRRT
jgi:hypothetical protein